MQLFKGRLENGNQVAIRCLPLSKKFSIRNLKLRLDLLSKLQHQHLVYLLGHCLGDGGRAAYNLNKVYLVYEYVPNGSFRDHLCGNSWTFDKKLVLRIPSESSVDPKSMHYKKDLLFVWKCFLVHFSIQVVLDFLMHMTFHYVYGCFIDKCFELIYNFLTSFFTLHFS